MMATEWAAAAMKLLLWGALIEAQIERPPAKYDHPYPGEVRYVWDFPAPYGTDHLWGYTHPPKRGGPCIMHLSPVGQVVNNEVMTEASLRALIQHERAHCNGWRH